MGASENNSNKDKGQQKASVAQQGQQKASLALQGQQEASLAQQGQREASAAEHQEEGSVGQTGQQEGNVAPKDAEVVPKAPVVHPTVSRHKKKCSHWSICSHSTPTVCTQSGCESCSQAQANEWCDSCKSSNS